MLELMLLGILSSFIYFRVQILNIIRENKLQKEIIFTLLILLTFYNFGVTISSTLSVLIFIVILYKKKCVELSGTLWDEIVKFEKIMDNAIENSSTENNNVDENAIESVDNENVDNESVVESVESVESEDSVIKESKNLKKKVKLAKKMSKIKKRMNSIMEKMTEELDDGEEADTELSD